MGLILADGTRINGSCGYAEKNLWVWIEDMTIAECFDLFNSPLRTQKITCEYFTHNKVYTGFTVIKTIRVMENTIDICLNWPEGGEHSIIDIPVTPPKFEEPEIENEDDEEEEINGKEDQLESPIQE